MGGSASRDDHDLGPLPQQQIVSMTDGQTTHTGTIAPGVSRVGQSMTSTAVRAPLRLLQVSLNSGGDVQVDLSASRHGVVYLMASAIELERIVEGGESNSTHTKALWPIIQGEKLSNKVKASERCTISFAGSRQMLAGHDRQNSNIESLGDGIRRWPIVLQLIPVESLEAPIEEKSLEVPPDGSLMACCVIQAGEVKIARQLIAWGGEGAAYVLKELFGIQEATTAAHNESDIVDNQAQCVVCLTQLKDTALMPCGHFCVCYDCGVSIRLSPARNRCPLCRSDVSDIVKIDVAARSDLPAPKDEQVLAPTPVVEPLVTKAAIVEVEPTPTIETELASNSVPENVDVAKRGAASMDEVRAARLRRLGAPDPQQPGSQQASTTPPVDNSESHSQLEENAESTREVPPASSSTASSSDCLPPKCLRRLTQEMRQIEEKKDAHLDEHGITISLADPEGGDLRIWLLVLRTQKVDVESQLGKALRSVGATEIVFEVWIPNGFPILPPKVRVLRPTFRQNSFYVQAHGALCMETLTNQGWSPALSLLQLGVQIKTIMTAGSGSISSLNPMGDGCREEAWRAFERVENAHSDWNTFGRG